MSRKNKENSKCVEQPGKCMNEVEASRGVLCDEKVEHCESDGVSGKPFKLGKNLLENM